MSKPFAHLQVSSAHSLRYGTAHPDAIVQRAAEHGQRILALTDRDTVSGAVAFIRACAKHDISPVLGGQLALIQPTEFMRTPAHGGRWLRRELPRVTLLAHNRQSWAGLCAAITAAHRNRLEPAITAAELSQLAGEYGLVLLLGPRSDVGAALAQRRTDLAENQLRTWRAQGADVYLEVVTHREAPGGLSDAFAARMLAWAVEQRNPAVITNQVRYLAPEHAKVADVLDAARAAVPLTERYVIGRTNQAFLADSEHMVATAERIAAFCADRRDLASSLLRQTIALAERCVIDPSADLGMGRTYVPELSQLLPDERRSAAVVLRQRCAIGLEQYLERQPQQRDSAEARLEQELAVLGHLGLPGYVLTVAEVVDMIKRMGIRVAARGSGAGSLVNHLLGISGVDPIAHNLLMERFVSSLRPGLPDIDIDVESARRTEVYDAVFARFGAERTTCVSMHETYRIRHAIRDVGLALSLPAGDVATLARSFPHLRAGQMRSALAELPELRRSGLGHLIGTTRFELFVDLVEALDGLPRNVALHPCGVVLSDSSLLTRTPVQLSAQDYPMTQFDKDDVEHMGLLKLDILGVRMQSTLAFAVNHIEQRTGEHIDLDRIPLDDVATYELIKSTRTLGCFQIESPGQRDLVGRLVPTEFNDLVVDISLFRPGPVKSDMITPYLRARHGWAPPRYPHPDLVPVLQQTAGVVVFHEQVMGVIDVLTGCGLEYADLVRRQLGDRDRIDPLRVWFYQSAKARGYSLEVVEETWEILRAFASFGFCRAHAAAFALPTYQSAWLKTHYPAEFIAGVLTHDPGMYPKRLIVDDARAMGLTIRGLSVNQSGRDWLVEDDGETLSLRVPFSEVRGISFSEIEQAISAAPYDSLADFVARSGATRATVERIVLAGGFDDVHLVDRRDLLMHLGELPKGAGQRSLDLWQPVATGLPPMRPSERVRHEIEVLGIDLSAHVCSFYLPMLSEIGATLSADLLSLRSRSQTLVAGVKVATQTPPIRTGRRVAFITLDDSTGPVDATFFEEALDWCAPTLFHSWLLLVRGTVRRTGENSVSIQADACWELGEVWRLWSSSGVAAVHALLNAEKPNPLSGTPTRVWEHASGLRTSPYADVRPAGVDLTRGMRSAARMAP